MEPRYITTRLKHEMLNCYWHAVLADF